MMVLLNVLHRLSTATTIVSHTVPVIEDLHISLAQKITVYTLASKEHKDVMMIAQFTVIKMEATRTMVAILEMVEVPMGAAAMETLVTLTEMEKLEN